MPLLAAVFVGIKDEKAAVVSMITGGGTTISLIIFAKQLPLGLDANVFGISVSLFSFVIIYSLLKKTKHGNSNL